MHNVPLQKFAECNSRGASCVPHSKGTRDIHNESEIIRIDQKYSYYDGCRIVRCFCVVQMSVWNFGPVFRILDVDSESCSIPSYFIASFMFSDTGLAASL